MATSGPNQPPLGSSSVSAPQQPIPNPSNSDQITWDGDKMFNIYILDYCKKRGYHKTASQLVTEADIPPESKPPINAQQGLLFEWWSVFWVLFQAKNSGQGSDDAMLYHRHQSQVKLRTAPGTLPGVPQPPGRYSLPNGAVPPMSNSAINGMGPTGQPQSHPAPPYGPTNPTAQPNGLAGHPAPPGHPGQPFPGGMVGRPLGPQQRMPNGGPPYQSPTIAPSPQSQGNPQQPPANPMAQLGRSPHMSNLSRPQMPPPNGLQHAQGSGPPGSAHPTPTIPYQQLGRPSSGLDTPSHNPMNPHRSPAMGGRMPPGQERHMENTHNTLDAELNSYPPDIMGEAKLRAGVGDRDAQSLTVEEKQNIIGHAARLKQGQQQNTGPSGGNVHGQMQNRGPMAQPMQQQLSLQQQRGGKRSSTSPGEEHQTLPRNEQSPPDRKRQRKATPNSAEQQQQQPQSQPQQPQQQQQQSQPQQQPQPQQPQQAPHPPQQQQQQQQPQQPPMAPIGTLQSGLQHMQGAGNARGMPMSGGQGPPGGFGGPQMHPMGMMTPMHAMSPGMGHGPPLGVMNPQHMGIYAGQYRPGMVNPPPQHKGGPGDPQSQVHMRGPPGPGAMPNRPHGQLGPPQPGQPGQPPKMIGGHMLPPGQPGMNMPPKKEGEGEHNPPLNPPPASTPTPLLNAPPPMNPQRPPTAPAPLHTPAPPPPSAGPGGMTDFGFDVNDMFGNASGDFSFDADTLGDMNLFFDPTAVHDGSSLDIK